MNNMKLDQVWRYLRFIKLIQNIRSYDQKSKVHGIDELISYFLLAFISDKTFAL